MIRRGQALSIETIIITLVLLLITIGAAYLGYKIFTQTESQATGVSSRLQEIQQNIQLSGKKVLIYGDFPQEASRLKEYLESSGAQVDVIEWGGVQPTEVSKYDIVYVIPRRSGYIYISSGNAPVRIFPYDSSTIRSDVYGEVTLTGSVTTVTESTLYRDVLDRVDLRSFHVVSGTSFFAQSLRYSDKDRTNFPDDSAPTNRDYLSCGIWSNTYSLNAVYTMYLKAYVPRDLVVVAQYPETKVVIKDLSDGDDNKEITLLYPGQTFVYASPYDASCTSSNSFDNDIVEIIADKPVLVLYGVVTRKDVGSVIRFVPSSEYLTLYLPSFLRAIVYSPYGGKLTVKKGSYIFTSSSEEAPVVFTQYPIALVHFSFEYSSNEVINLGLFLGRTGSITNGALSEGVLGRGIKLDSGSVSVSFPEGVPINSIGGTLFVKDVGSGTILELRGGSRTIRLTYDTSTLRLYVYDGSNSAEVSLRSVSLRDKYHFIAFSVSSKEVCLYVDEALSKCVSANLRDTHVNKLEIGPITGYIDELKIYDKPITKEYAQSVLNMYYSQIAEPPVQIQSSKNDYKIFIYTTTPVPLLEYTYGHEISTLVKTRFGIIVYNPNNKPVKISMKVVEPSGESYTQIFVVGPHETKSNTITFLMPVPVSVLTLFSEEPVYFAIEPYEALNALPLLEPIKVDNIPEHEETRIVQMSKYTKLIILYDPLEKYSVLPIEMYGMLVSKQPTLEVNSYLRTVQQFSVISTIDFDTLEASRLSVAYIPVYYVKGTDFPVIATSSIHNRIALVPSSVLQFPSGISVLLALADYI